MALKRVEVKKKVFIMKTEKKIKFSNFNDIHGRLQITNKKRGKRFLKENQSS